MSHPALSDAITPVVWDAMQDAWHHPDFPSEEQCCVWVDRVLASLRDEGWLLMPNDSDTLDRIAEAIHDSEYEGPLANDGIERAFFLQIAQAGLNAGRENF